ncbi:MAG TPA: hypothetical protein DD629_07730, partial [Treponema sp.]|nr:hypothetical protein [Treponema sp.]
MNKFSLPGVYVSEQQYTLNSLQIDTRCLTAFAGICEKGPVGEPVFIESFDGYLKHFGGFDTEGVLPLSVYSYFKCGGKECIVTRIAHKESVRNAELELKCQICSLRLTALTPGTWGNYLCAKLWYEYERASCSIEDAVSDGSYIILDREADLEQGDIVELNLGAGRTIYREISV